jgi:predicted ATPase
VQLSPAATVQDLTSRSFVGRRQEIVELSLGLDDAIAGRGRLFLLSGEPGIGKTRLAEEVAIAAISRGMRALWGRCWEGGGAPAYWPWIQIIRACLAEADAEQRTAILGSEAAPQIVQDIAQLLPELNTAHAHTLKHPAPQPSDLEQARFQLFQSVATLLKNVARIAPLLLVIDDLHDADHPSLLMQKFIAGQIKDARILMVGTYRDTEVRQSQELSKLIGDMNREGYSIPIAGLSQAEVGEFVESSAGKKADDKLVADLYQATDGNPLFVDGVVRLLVAEGKLGRARLHSSAFSIPDGVRESIRRQLVKLQEETTALLSIASTIGTDFETGLLGRVSGSAAQEIVERMDEAERARIVIDYATGASRFRFSHALVREALYKDLSAKRRIELHGEIGAAIEGLHKDNLKPHLAALAHHFRAAGNARKAMDYSIAAADAAEAVFAYEDALAHLRPVLAMAESREHDDSQRAAILLRLGRISCFFESREQGLAHLETALKIYEQIGDDQHAGEIHSHLGRVFGVFGPQMHVGHALTHLQRAEILLRETSEEHSLGLLYLGLAVANFEKMRIDEAILASQKAMNIFTRLRDRESWASVAGRHATYLMVKGKLARAVTLLDEIAGAAADSMNPDTFPQMTWLYGWYHVLMKNPREAARLYRLGLEKPGFLTSLRTGFEFLTVCELAMGDLAEAKRLAAENIVNESFRSRIAFYDGDWKTNAQILEWAFDWAVNVDSEWNQLNTLAYVIESRRVWGDYGGAAAAFEQALGLYRPDDFFWEIRVRPQIAMACVDAGQNIRAAEHQEYCRKILAEQENWLGQAAPVWRAEGAVAAAQDRLEESDRNFEKSVEICKQYFMPWEEADTLYYWGRALLHAGQPHRAQEKLDAAIRIYRDCGGGQIWIDRVEADRRRAEPLRAEPRPQNSVRGAETAGGEAVFRNEGDFWTISYLDHYFRIRDIRGLHYIAYLLAHPNERFHVRDLAAIVGGDTPSGAAAAELGVSELRTRTADAAPILDHKAKADYRARLSELRADLDEAERMNDTGRAERARHEIEFVNDELSAAAGLAGRDRKMSDQAERARLRIGRVIRWALSEIREHDPSLGHHLTTCIHTGYYCAYTPDPRQQRSRNL